jgi:hypothetical protein
MRVTREPFLRAWSFAWLALLVPLVWPTTAEAIVRRRFEPTDLELQPAGTLEIDAQLSYTEGETAGRVIVPDFEMSLGIAPNVQLEIDGAYAVEGKPIGRFSFDHPAPDNLWISSKLGLADWRDDDDASAAWALGAQLGPKVPLAPGARGDGFEALVLVGRKMKHAQLVLDLGGLIDPSQDGSLHRSTAIEGGIDVSIDLDADGRFAILGELGAMRFFSGEAPQSHVTCGLQWSPSAYLDLSVVGLLGFLSAGDRGGVLLGITPRFALW